MNNEFTDEQKNYLAGFFTGVSQGGLTFAQAQPAAGPQPLEAPPEKKKKRIPEEQIKADLHPFDAYPRLKELAKADAEPEKPDIFRFKWNGLFWLAPVVEGYMCRLRIPGGIVTSHQVRALSDTADDLASGFLQITTRNNFQIRVIQPKDTPELLRRIQDCGLHSRGSGADNLRNFTSNPTSGIDPHELIDVLPYIKDLAHYVINNLEFYDLPRKFNVSYDGGGLTKVAEDTNDIGLRAIQLKEPPEGHPLHGKLDAGVYFQILLGGVTGHKEFAENAGVICRPEDSVDVVAALTKVFIRNGNRGNRGKARMVYLIKKWGFEKYIAETLQLLGEDLLFRFDPDNADDAALVVPHEKPNVPHPHVGVHPQKQEGLSYIGVQIPVGILEADKAREVARVADEFGSGEVRLTIFQNLIIPNVPNERVEAAQAALAGAGLVSTPSMIRGGTAACTGNLYCKFAASNTKGAATSLIDYLDDHIEFDQPINIHVTGCPHSCAQHYIGDIGMLACKVKQEDGESVEGFHVFVGGGFAENRRLGRQILKSVPSGEILNKQILVLLRAYLDQRNEGESFQDFTVRHEVEELQSMIDSGMRKKVVA
ncbi:MAG: NirA family protein [Verrucomicrobiota bacterium]